MNNKEVIEQILCWKDAFTHDMTKDDIAGREEIEDLLDGIHHDGHNCYASFIFEQLSEKQKKEIQRELDGHGIYIQFEELIAVYDSNYIKTLD